MSNVTSIAHLREYVLTYKGQQALKFADTCLCSYILKDGWLFCIFCGTAAKPLRPDGRQHGGRSE